MVKSHLLSTLLVVDVLVRTFSQLSAWPDWTVSSNAASLVVQLSTSMVDGPPQVTDAALVVKTEAARAVSVCLSFMITRLYLLRWLGVTLA